MSESRDSNDPRDAMRGMRKETEAELERAETGQTGGQEHASPAHRESDAERRLEEQYDDALKRVTREQSDAGDLRVPRGDPVTGGGNAAGGPTPTADEDEAGRGRS